MEGGLPWTTASWAAQVDGASTRKGLGCLERGRFYHTRGLPDPVRVVLLGVQVRWFFGMLYCRFSMLQSNLPKQKHDEISVLLGLLFVEGWPQVRFSPFVFHDCEQQVVSTTCCSVQLHVGVFSPCFDTKALSQRNFDDPWSDRNAEIRPKDTSTRLHKSMHDSLGTRPTQGYGQVA